MKKYKRSHIAKKLLLLDGKPMRFTDYPFMPGVYDINASELVLKTGRQVGKTTMDATLITVDSISIPHYKSLFISPSRDQTSKFSNTRLTKLFNYSPLIRDIFIDPKNANSVFLRVLKNGAEIALSYADDDPDRVRGITADSEYLDEIQDILYDAVVPVVKECMSNSDYYNIVYSGTPKTMDNTIEFLWQKSTQAEWIMKCTGCNKWQYVDSIKSLGKLGLVCVKCGKALNPRLGKWYAFNPNAYIKGFHVPQPILPKNNESPARWSRLLVKMEDYSSTKFNNEVLGMSDAVGGRFITQDELLDLCDDYYVDLPVSAGIRKGIKVIVAGVDWGGGGSASHGKLLVSRTVLWVWGLNAEFKLKTLYFKIYKEDNPADNVEDIGSILTQIGCQYVMGDAGGGAIANSMLGKMLGQHRVGQAQYGGGAGFTKLIRWSQQGQRYLVNRDAAIDSYMIKLKRKSVIFPNARQSAIPIEDILSEYEDVVTAGGKGTERKAWRHSPSVPDDCLHAQIFGDLALKVVQGSVEFYAQTD